MTYVLLVDFKYDGKKATIVEFGCGLNSSYTGYDAIHNHQEYIMYTRIYEKLAEKYDKIICVTKWDYILKGEILKQSKLSSDHYSVVEASTPRGMALRDFKKPEEIVDEINKILANKKKTEKYCIVVNSENSLEALTIASKLKRSKMLLQNIDIINANEAIGSITRNKFMYAYLGGKDHVRTTIIDLNSISEAKLQIVSKFDRVVIKPTDGSGGHGVMVVANKELKQHLSIVKFLNDFKDLSYKIYEYLPSREQQKQQFGKVIDRNDKAYDGWLGSETSHYALLQEYQPGKIIQDYNPTGRMVFIVNDANEIDFIDGYWKLPPHKFNDEEENNSKKYVSDAHRSDKQTFSLAIDENDKRMIQASLSEAILPIIKIATSRSLKQHIDEIKKDSDPDISSYAPYLLETFKELLYDSAENQHSVTQSIQGISGSNSIWHKNSKTEIQFKELDDKCEFQSSTIIHNA